MRSWIELDQLDLNAPVRENIRGADVEVMAPPQDVPGAVRSYFDKTNQRYVIEFKYLGGDEDLIVGAGDNLIQFMVGRDSGRLFRINISGDQGCAGAAASHLSAELRSAIDALNTQYRSPRRTGNYRVATEVIQAKRKELLDDLLPH